MGDIMGVYMKCYFWSLDLLFVETLGVASVRSSICQLFLRNQYILLILYEVRVLKKCFFEKISRFYHYCHKITVQNWPFWAEMSKNGGFHIFQNRLLEISNFCTKLSNWNKKLVKIRNCLFSPKLFVFVEDFEMFLFFFIFQKSNQNF